MYVKKSYQQQATEVGEKCKELFGELTPEQLWQIVKIAKIARRSCRHNTAFNTMMACAFPYARFQQVEKTGKDGRTYQGLTIKTPERLDGYSEDDTE